MEKKNVLVPMKYYEELENARSLITSGYVAAGKWREAFNMRKKIGLLETVCFMILSSLTMIPSVIYTINGAINMVLCVIFTIVGVDNISEYCYDQCRIMVIAEKAMRDKGLELAKLGIRWEKAAEKATDPYASGEEILEANYEMDSCHNEFAFYAKIVGSDWR